VRPAIAVPKAEIRLIPTLKKSVQVKCFAVAVTEYQVGSAVMLPPRSLSSPQVAGHEVIATECPMPSHNDAVPPIHCITKGDHTSWIDYLRISDCWGQDYETGI